jgi:hypothetical protein
VSASIPIDPDTAAIYDPAKDKRAPFLKVNLHPTGPTIEEAHKPLLQRAKEAITENIPNYSSRTVYDPKYGKESFLPDSDVMTSQERREHPVVAGALDAASGLATPATLATVAATAGVGEAGLIPKVLSGLFAGQIAVGVYDQYPALKAAVDKAQHAKTTQEHDDAFAEAQQLLTHMGADTVMGLLAAKHGAEGAKEILDSTTGSGVPDQASTFKAPQGPAAPEPEETHPEMNRDTVKSLQKLGYSNQHITNFNISEIRDILKNNTPAVDHPVSKPAGPDPDAFAASGGKLVGPTPTKAASAAAAPEAKITTDSNGTKWAENENGVRVSIPQRIPEAQVQEYAATQLDSQAKMQADAKAKVANAADPIEDLLMSDKIQGKKVRGATPKPTEIPAQQGRRAGVGGVNRTLPEDSSFAFRARSTDKLPYDSTSNGGDMGRGGKAWLNTDGTFDPQDEVHKNGLENLAKGNIRIGNLERDGSVLFHANDVPTEAQRAAIGKDIAKQGVIYDLTNKSGERISGETDKPGEFWRAVDKFYGVGPQPDAFASSGGKFVGKTPEPAAPAVTYHPDLQKVIDLPGVTVHQNASQVTGAAHFVTPDGKFVRLPRGLGHPEAVAKAVGGAAYDPDNRVRFLNDTGALRIRPSTGKAGETLHVSVPAGGVTPEQVDALQRSVQAMGKNGNLVLERADINAENKDTASTTIEQVKPYQVEDALKKIGAHPEQAGLVTSELQTPHKETYEMEITDRVGDTNTDGEVHTEKIDAHSPKQAIALAQKKFPDAHQWRLATMPEEKALSTEYSVPTKNLATMPASADRPVVHTIRHELGHALVGQNEGMGVKAMISSTHPKGGRNMRAAVDWDATGVFNFNGHPYPEKIPMLVRTFMGGIAADEVFNDLPRSTNHNFNIATRGSDGQRAYSFLRAEGVSHEQAFDYMHQAIEDGKAYLAKPEVSDIIKENANVREAGLSRQYHYSPERLQNMHAEAQRRIQNGAEQPNNGAINGQAAGGRETADTRGESGSAQGTGEGVPAEEGIVSEEKSRSPQKPAKLKQNPPVGYITPAGKFDPFQKGETSHMEAAHRLMGYGDPQKSLDVDAFDEVLKAGYVRKAGQGSYDIRGELNPQTKAALEHDILLDSRDLKTGGKYKHPANIVIENDDDGYEFSVDDFIDKYNGSLDKAMNAERTLTTAEVKKPAAMTPKIAQQIVDAHTANGGSTFNLHQGDLAGTDNYAVAAHPERGEVLDHQPTTKDIQAFAKKNADLLKDPEKSIGTWHDTSNDTHALDVVATMPDREKAIALGKANDQKAIFGLKNNEEINTGGTGAVPVGGTAAAPAAPAAPPESADIPTVSTRVPSRKVKGVDVEDHTNQALTSDMDAAKAAPGYMQKMVDKIIATPGFKAPEGGDAQAIAEAYIRHVADNTKFVFNKLKPENVKKDEQWYPVGAHQRGLEVAKQHGYTPAQIFGVTSVESPMTDWDANTAMAERTASIWKNQQKTKFTPEMRQAADDILTVPAMGKFKTLFKGLEGKTLAELPNIEDKAWWLRLYDEGHNPRSYQTWNPDGTSGGFAKNIDGVTNKNLGWSFQNHIQKAISILQDGSPENISASLGYGHKVRNFYNNQLAPDDPRYLTIDTHAVNIAQLRPMSGKNPGVTSNFGTISNGPHGLSGVYPLHDAGYRLAAKELGISIPSRLQSPTWVEIRNVFTDDFKTKENLASIDAIWKEHSDGKITADDARNKIWDFAERWNRENTGKTGSTSDQGKLFDAGVRGTSTKGTGSGNRGATPAPVSKPEVDEGDTSFDFGANEPERIAPARVKSNVPKMTGEGLIKALHGLNKPSGKIPTKFRQNLNAAESMSDPDTRFNTAQHEAGHVVISEMLRPGAVQGVGLDDSGGYTNIAPPAGKTEASQLSPEEIRNLVAVSYAGGMVEPGGTTAKHVGPDQARRADILGGGAVSTMSNIGRLITGHTLGTDQMLQANQQQAEAKARVTALLADPAVRQNINTLATHITTRGHLSGDEIRSVLKKP